MADVAGGLKGGAMDVATMLRSKDLGIAEKSVNDIIDPRRFHYRGRAKASEVRISHVEMNVGHLFGVRHGVPVHVTSEPIRSYQIMVPLRGRLQAHTEVAPGNALIYSPEDSLDTYWSGDCLALVLSLPGGKFRDFLRQVFPESEWRTPPKFNPQIDLNTGCGRSFANVLWTICRESLDDGSAFRQGITTRALEESLLLSLVQTFRADLLPLNRRASPCRSFVIERAVEFINGHCHDEISSADLVKAAGASLRTLQMGFLERFGVGPMTYLRQIRLRRVHEALVAAGAGHETVGDIAARWGFYNGSSFAKAYREFFGELPSETLFRR